MAIERSSRAHFRRHNHHALIAALFLCTIFLYSCHRSQINSSPLYCPDNTLADETLLVLRTGATEVAEKLPVHVDTTLRCIPHYVIYSDYSEKIAGNNVYDVFDELSTDFTGSLPDFDLYRKLQTQGRKGLALDNSISIGIDHQGSGPLGSPTNPGWKLDKFKFLPMVDKALRHRPEAKWFVFAELDTYLLWGNLLEYLSQFDAQKPYYIGRQMFLGGRTLFAYGGAGFVLSAPAATKLVEHWKAHMAEYNQYTIQQWAGDVVLGKALKDVDIALLWAFPHFQNDPVSSLDHNLTMINRHLWCYPAISYHHMKDDDIRSLWEFEQSWQRDYAQHGGGPLRHAHVFREYIYPRLSAERTEWDNYSVKFNEQYVLDGAAHTSFEACRAACQSHAMCLQFSYGASKCLISHELRLGKQAKLQCWDFSGPHSKCDTLEDVQLEPADGDGDGDVGVDEGGARIGRAVRSGWMIDRLPGYVRALDQTCSASNGWITT